MAKKTKTKPSPATYYVAFFFDKDKYAGNIITSDLSSIPASLTEFKATDSTPSTTLIRYTPKETHTPFGRCFADFTQSMIGYSEFAPVVAGLGIAISSDLSHKSPRQFLDAVGSKVDQAPDRVVYNAPGDSYGEFIRLTRSVSAINGTAGEVPKMIIIGLLATFEYYIARTMRAIAELKPQSIFTKEKSITVAELMASPDIAEIKRRLIDREIDVELRASFEDQITWIEERCEIKKSISSEFRPWPELMELIQRRNIFVHANGIVSEQYIRAAKVHGFNTKTSLGGKLSVSPKYLQDALRLIVDFGTKLIQVAWQKTVEGEDEVADDLLNEFGFELLVRGQYRIGASVLEFGAKTLKKHSSDSVRRTLVINHANALKLQGHAGEAIKALDAEDWSASKESFNLCVAAVKGDIEKVLGHMKTIGASGEVRLLDYQQGPVFYHVRDDVRFVACIKKIFGTEFTPAPQKRAGFRQILDAVREGARQASPEAEDGQAEDKPASVH